jgi:uncharacterized protein YjiS (DUF1127 family)
MATFDTSRTTYGSSIVAGRITTLVARALIAVIAWNDARVTRKALGALTDRELDDIGLTRADIDLVADNKIIR